MESIIDRGLSSFIAALPKTETHLHIEGSLDWNLLHDLDPVKFSEPPASYARDFKFLDFAHFERELLEMAFSWFTSPERYYEGARRTFQRHLEQNVRYVETSFASGVIEFLGLDGKEIIAALQSAVPAGLEVRFFLGIHHNGYNEKMKPILDDAVNWEGLAGFDLHGTETFPMESWTAGLWAASKEAGKFNKAHAGEFCGPDFVKWIIDALKVNRLQHGVRASEDGDVVAYLRDNDVTCDTCPISNFKLNVVDEISRHPIRKLHDAGVRCTVSTDDPLSFGNTLVEEYETLACDLGFSHLELCRIARNGFEIALVPDEWKAPVYAELDQIEGQFER